MNDTRPQAQAVQIELLRRAGATRRSEIALRLSDDVIARSRRALQEQMPGATETEVRLRWVELWYGRDVDIVCTLEQSHVEALTELLARALREAEPTDLT